MREWIYCTSCCFAAVMILYILRGLLGPYDASRDPMH